MSSPINHGILTSAYTEYIKRKYDIKSNNILFKDYWYDLFRKLGISRQDMLIVMPFVLKVDVLTDVELLEPYEL